MKMYAAMAIKIAQINMRGLTFLNTNEPIYAGRSIR